MMEVLIEAARNLPKDIRFKDYGDGHFLISVAGVGALPPHFEAELQRVGDNSVVDCEKIIYSHVACWSVDNNQKAIFDMVRMLFREALERLESRRPKPNAVPIAYDLPIGY